MSDAFCVSLSSRPDATAPSPKRAHIWSVVFDKPDMSRFCCLGAFDVVVAKERELRRRMTIEVRKRHAYQAHRHSGRPDLAEKPYGLGAKHALIVGGESSCI